MEVVPEEERNVVLEYVPSEDNITYGTPVAVTTLTEASTTLTLVPETPTNYLKLQAINNAVTPVQINSLVITPQNLPI